MGGGRRMGACRFYLQHFLPPPVAAAGLSTVGKQLSSELKGKAKQQTEHAGSGKPVLSVFEKQIGSREQWEDDAKRTRGQNGKRD